MADKDDKSLAVEDNEPAVKENAEPAVPEDNPKDSSETVLSDTPYVSSSSKDSLSSTPKTSDSSDTSSKSNPSTPLRTSRPILKTVEISDQKETGEGQNHPDPITHPPKDSLQQGDLSNIPSNQSNTLIPEGEKPADKSENISQNSHQETLDVSKILDEENTGNLGMSLPDNHGGKKRLLILAILIVLVLVGGGGFYMFNQNSKNIEQKNAVKTVEENKKVTPTKKPGVFKREEWTLEVLNGTKIPGLAKKTSEDLTKLGYNVIKTENADESTYSQAQIFIQEGKTAPKQLLSDMEMVINVSSVSGEFSDSTASARIILVE